MPPRPTRLPTVPSGPSGRAANAAAPSDRTGTPPGRSRLGTSHGRLTTRATPATSPARPPAPGWDVDAKAGSEAGPRGLGPRKGSLADRSVGFRRLSTTPGRGHGGQATRQRATPAAIRPPAGLPKAATAMAATSRRLGRPVDPVRRATAASATQGRAA
jgi:hypothetical protein